MHIGGDNDGGSRSAAFAMNDEHIRWMRGEMMLDLQARARCRDSRVRTCAPPPSLACLHMEQSRSSGGANCDGQPSSSTLPELARPRSERFCDKLKIYKQQKKRRSKRSTAFLAFSSPRAPCNDRRMCALAVQRPPLYSVDTKHRYHRSDM